MKSLRIDTGFNARACCAVRDKVWVAKQSGDMAIYEVPSHEHIGDVLVSVEGTKSAIIRCLVNVFDEVWTATVDGHLLTFSARDHAMLTAITLPSVGSDAGGKNTRIVDLTFNGHVVVVATDSGRIYLFNPITRKHLCTLAGLSPCSAVAQFYSFVVGGDMDGGLSMWDVVNGECVTSNTKSKSGVTRILHEPSSGLLWVGRENGNLDAYRFNDRELVLAHRVKAIGRVTGLVAVSGNVIVTTFEKRMLTVDAASGSVVAMEEAAHRNFIHGAAKVSHSETALLWSFSNDGGMRVWEVTGRQVPTAAPPLLHPRTQAGLAICASSSLIVENARLAVSAEAARGAAVDVAEELRRAREEAQELRLRVLALEEATEVRDLELAKRMKELKDLEETHARTVKDVTDITAKVSMVERERTQLQADLSSTREELSKSRTETFNMLTEKSKLDQEISQLKTDKCQLENRVRDAEGRVASVLAENARLCASIGNVSAAKSAEKEMQNRILQASAQVSEELAQMKKLNRLMSSLMASMEYTIRRKEEEERDLTALLNAYRRKVADRVMDPFLSALLVATMVRNPDRFEMDCDETTKAQLLDRNGPFIQFIHSLRASDTEAYEKLMRYLQDQSLADSLSPESHGVLDKLLSLAMKEGSSIGSDVVASFKRGIPALVDANTAAAAAALLQANTLLGNSTTTTGNTTTTGAPIATASPTTAVGPMPIPGAAPTSTATTITTITTTTGPAAGSTPSAITTGTTSTGTAAPAATATAPTAGPEMTAYMRYLNAEKAAREAASSSLLREIRSQRAVDENYIREQQALFEFILKTRRTLVECIVLLYRRTVSARQVIEALSVNLGVGGSISPSAIASSSGVVLTPKKTQPLHSVMLGIIVELVELTNNIVVQYLTSSEKQRLNVQ